MLACAVAALVVCARPADAGGEPPGVSVADTVAAPGVSAADSLAEPAVGGLGTQAADSLATPAVVETVSVVTVPRAPRTPRALPVQPRLDRPRWVMLRSLLVPGWGQMHNRAWVKAALVAAGDGLLRVRFIRDERRLGRLNRDAFGRLGDLTSAVGDTTAAGAAYRTVLGDTTSTQEEIDAAQAALIAANIQLRLAGDAYNDVVSAYNALLESSIRRRWVLGGVVLYALIDAYVDAHFKRFDVDFQFDPALPGGSTTPGARLQLRWSF